MVWGGYWYRGPYWYRGAYWYGVLICIGLNDKEIPVTNEPNLTDNWQLQLVITDSFLVPCGYLIYLIVDICLKSKYSLFLLQGLQVKLRSSRYELKREQARITPFATLASSRSTTIQARGGGGALNKFLYGEAPPRGPDPLPFYMPFLTKKGTPFVYLPLKNGSPSHTYLRALHPFSKPLEGSFLVVFM